MEDIIDEHKDSMRFPPKAAEDFQKACFSMFHLQHGLQMHFRNNGNRKVFNLTSKSYQLEAFEPTQNLVFPRGRSDEKGSKVGTELPEEAEWHGCDHQNGEASQVGYAFCLEQVLKRWQLSGES